jgi:hypothetical protein
LIKSLYYHTENTFITFLPSLGYQTKIIASTQQVSEPIFGCYRRASGLFKKGFKGVSKDFGLPFAY